MSKAPLIASAWILVAFLLLIVPFYWAIAFKWTDGGARMAEVVDHYSIVWALVLSGCVFGGIWLIIIGPFLAVSLANYKHRYRVLGAWLCSMPFHLVLRLPIGAALIAASCEPVYGTLADSQEFAGCSAYNKDMAYCGLFLDWILVAVYAVVSLAVFTLGRIFCWC